MLIAYAIAVTLLMIGLLSFLIGIFFEIEWLTIVAIICIVIFVAIFAFSMIFSVWSKVFFACG